MTLFQEGSFTLHSGGSSYWKIDCDALTDADWHCLARMIYELCKPFKQVIGIPRGGIKLAKALKQYTSPNPENPILIVDDVLTTGKSMRDARTKCGENSIGAIIFARGKCPEWITPLFTIDSKLLEVEHEDS